MVPSLPVVYRVLLLQKHVLERSVTVEASESESVAFLLLRISLQTKFTRSKCVVLLECTCQGRSTMLANAVAM
jgi:hypothetical protein